MGWLTRACSLIVSPMVFWAESSHPSIGISLVAPHFHRFPNRHFMTARRRARSAPLGHRRRRQGIAHDFRASSRIWRR